ncbi:MAG: hypothetical protein B7733_25740 [Myxococcales bacterium FL481]|nr:MAG: hypothetical protein B7733_25740 [Myxococcales bacterium FL481]
MTSRSLLLAGLFTATLAAPAVAHAGKDMAGRMGVGAQRTLAGASELSFKWFIIQRLSLGFGAGMVLDADDVDDDRVRQSTFSFSPSVFGWFLRTKEVGPVAASLGLGVRPSMIIHNGNDTTVVEPVLEVPLAVEVYVGEHFAIQPEAGVTFRINSNGNRDRFSNTIGAGSGAAIMGGGSFHFYF